MTHAEACLSPSKTRVENLADHVTFSGSPLSSAETLEVSRVYVHRLILGVLQVIFEQISLPKASKLQSVKLILLAGAQKTYC